MRGKFGPTGFGPLEHYITGYKEHVPWYVVVGIFAMLALLSIAFGLLVRWGWLW